MIYVHCPDRPDVLAAPWVSERYAELLARLPAAEASEEAEAWLQLYSDWNELKSCVESEGSRRRYAFSKDMADGAAEEAEREHREEFTPVAEDGDSKLVAALLASRHRGAVADRFGAQLLRVLEVTEATLAPANSELRVKVGELSKRYDKLRASGEVSVGGEVMTMPRAWALLSSSDGALRREAFEAYFDWFLAQRDALAAIFDEQVALRDRMGRNLGHENFVPLGYAGMARTDYGPEEAATFRAAVREHAAPIFGRLCREQAALLGEPTLRPWDAGYHPGLTLPTGAAEPVDEQLDKAGRVFERLSPKLYAHFERMRREGLIDLENRKGKSAGAFCTDFSDEGRVAIFCNSTGDESDISTLTHEMGHAFMGWESLWIEPVDLRWPTADAAEIHSMGMEFLSLPRLEEFFEAEQHARFVRNRWRRAISLLCYVCVVDEFQHWVYEHPGASAEERDREFIAIRARYMPGIDWSGEAEKYAPLRWYVQLHIFRYPFYYIDYAIAETCAMQLGMLDARDHEGTMETYLELCRLGGTGSLTELVAGAGLRSPFEPELMRDLMAHAAEQVGSF